MLRTRIITALILAPAILAAVHFLPASWFALTFWLLAALGCYEWAGFAKLDGIAQRLAYVALFALAAWVLFANPQWYRSALLVGCVFWLFAILSVIVFPRGEALFRNPWLVGILGLFVVVPGWVGLVVIRAQEFGSFWLIWLLVLVWGADIGAYFAGKAYGQRKLAPAVSPGKTWEGALGGFALAALVCGVALTWLSQQWLVGWLVMVGLIVVSVFGDLFESVLKRSTGVKDSGTLLPGHGGVLDRVDSLLAVLPIFAFWLVSWS